MRGCGTVRAPTPSVSCVRLHDARCNAGGITRRDHRVLVLNVVEWNEPARLHILTPLHSNQSNDVVAALRNASDTFCARTRSEEPCGASERTRSSSSATRGKDVGAGASGARVDFGPPTGTNRAAWHQSYTAGGSCACNQIRRHAVSVNYHSQKSIVRFRHVCGCACV